MNPCISSQRRRIAERYAAGETMLSLPANTTAARLRSGVAVAQRNSAPLRSGAGGQNSLVGSLPVLSGAKYINFRPDRSQYCPEQIYRISEPARCCGAVQLKAAMERSEKATVIGLSTRRSHRRRSGRGSEASFSRLVEIDRSEPDVRPVVTVYSEVSADGKSAYRRDKKRDISTALDQATTEIAADSSGTEHQYLRIVHK
jgi:hypothetical protein